MKLEDVGSVKNGVVVISNYEKETLEDTTVLRPYESFMFLEKKK